VFADIADEDIAACLRVFEGLGQNLGCAMPELPGKPRKRKPRGTA
jgi:hypothetical protein